MKTERVVNEREEDNCWLFFTSPKEGQPWMQAGRLRVPRAFVGDTPSR